MHFRRDIEGLRAVAVLPVILFHAGVAPFLGGFVGVDVFFVISGYLITSLILAEERDTNQFSLGSFYERRIRRIFPVLFAVLAVSLALGWFLFIPQDYRSLSISAAAALLFASNFWFWQRSGYFDSDLATKPLLHTWSLAVEEQFYATFPICLRFTRHSHLQRVSLTVSVFVASLALSLILTPLFPDTAFYLAPTRAWELMLGALLALGVIASPRSAYQAGWASGTGLLLIGCATVLYSAKVPYPGLAALMPTLGAGLTIWGGQQATTISRWLGSEPIAFVGRISYSAYMWHFPFLAFARYVYFSPSPTVIAIALVGAGAVSVLSYYFIEAPFRNRRRLQRRAVFAAASGSFVALIVLSGAIAYSHGFPWRLTPRQAQLAAGASDMDQDRSECIEASLHSAHARGFCAIGSGNRPPQFVLWGDSLAEALRPALVKAAASTHTNGIYAGYYGCPPVMGVGRTDEPNCEKTNNAILAYILSTPSIRGVILDGDWVWWTEGRGITRGGNSAVPVSLVSEDASARGDNALLVRHGLERTIRELLASHRSVAIVGPLPEIGFDVPRALVLQSMGLNRGVGITLPLDDFVVRQKRVFSMLNSIEENYPVRMIWIGNIYCDSKSCNVERDGRPLYADGFHLSRFGASLSAPAFTRLLAEMNVGRQPH